MRERRQHFRLNRKVEVAHRVAGRILGASAVTTDISGGGVSFATFQKLDPGLVLNLDITLPGFKKPINAASRVVWQSQNPNGNERYAIGTEFVKIDELDRSRIAQYITLTARQKQEAGV